MLDDLPIIDEALAPAAGQSVATTQKVELDFEVLDLGKLARAKFAPMRKSIADAIKTLTGVQHDLPTQAKVDEAISLRKRLIKDPLADARKVSKGLKSKLDATSKEVGAELELTIADSEKADALITPQIDAAQAKIDEEKRIAAEKEAERVGAIHARITAIKACIVKAQAQDMTSARIQAGIDQLETMTFTPDVYAEFLEDARTTRALTVGAMLNLRDLAKSREDAEAVRLAEVARLEALRIENERIAAEQKAERDLLAAERAEFERQQVEFRAQQEAAAQVERDKQAAVTLAEQQKEDIAALEVCRREAQLQRDADAALAALETVTPAPPPAPAEGKRVITIELEEAPAFVPPALAEVPTLKLGDMCDRLGFTVRGDFIERIGFPAVAHDKAAKLYRQSDWPAICDAICASVQNSKVLIEAEA